MNGETEVSPFLAGLLCRCPRCGRGRLFDGLLQVAAICPSCDLDLSAQDPGDGPAIFVMLLVGGLAVGLAFMVETAFEPPIWLHLIYQIPFVLGASILFLRPFKATLIALQYRHRAAGFDDQAE
ncbi:MAG: DUF983 domain-containing protein [Alphaproteobacteria bacterium]|jgi:uncharacterized protein (DUF983 family)|nr:DUF983 domain-containing protein [Alphaproteobacteria bacterium]MDP6566065.1 DUF983 domain-containing protein [Alphaproteobacteria bacterium]MDP6812891.1 DUF983 domain-containing protein [Alphaproteobacteria bacterium]